MVEVLVAVGDGAQVALADLLLHPRRLAEAPAPPREEVLTARAAPAPMVPAPVIAPLMARDRRTDQAMAPPLTVLGLNKPHSCTPQPWRPQGAGPMEAGTREGLNSMVCNIKGTSRRDTRSAIPGATQ